MIRRQSESPPYLISIDHHSDTDDAFRKYVGTLSSEDQSINEVELSGKLVSAIDWQNEKSIEEAVSKLAHDEHIYAATQSGILAASFSIQLSDQEGWEDADNGIFVVSHKCSMDCDKKVYDDECSIHHALEIIETKYLEDQLRRINELTSKRKIAQIESFPYLLDIDLDAFHSMQAANPKDPYTFYRLIRGAVAITIATEPECVEDEWQDENNEPSADKLLTIVLNHINTAMEAEAPG